MIVGEKKKVIRRNCFSGDASLVDVEIASGVEAIRETKSPEELAFFERHQMHLRDIGYSFEKGYSGFCGCYMQVPTKERLSYDIPRKDGGGPSEMVTVELFYRGSKRSYDVYADGKCIESYELQRDAKASAHWPIFAALTAARTLKSKKEAK